MRTFRHMRPIPQKRMAVTESRSWGTCRDCRRPTWGGTDIPRGFVEVSKDRNRCECCYRSRKRGWDPTTVRWSPAERVPAERDEPTGGWRTNPDRGCADLDARYFDPDPDDDDPGYAPLGNDDRRHLDAVRRRIAETACAACPVRVECRNAADTMGYWGVWGGRLYDGTRWEDLVTGETGDTIYAGTRTEVRARLRRRAVGGAA